ncbi:MAG TPA: cupin domain-containing protein [Pyrinomonadaceae bacterium]|nr:cupin domain-containing protein [Pyrinomonadaceae bacterium]
MKSVAHLIISLMVFGIWVNAQGPISPSRPYIVKSQKQLSDISKEIGSKDGNQQFDVFAQAGTQMRVAVFHDENRENDLHEVHDESDDVYYVLQGEATLMLGGSLVDPQQVSSGEWRSMTSSGGQKVTIRKGDLVVVPRGTPHQRTVTGKGFSMILIKVFREVQPVR